MNESRIMASRAQFSTSSPARNNRYISVTRAVILALFSFDFLPTEIKNLMTSRAPRRYIVRLCDGLSSSAAQNCGWACWAFFFTVKKPETNRRRLKRWQRQKWTLSFSDVRGGKAGRLAISMARQHSSKSKATDDVIHSSAAKGRQWQPAARTAAAQTERDNWSSIYSLPVSPYTCIEVGGGAGQLESNDGSKDSLIEVEQASQ